MKGKRQKNRIITGKFPSFYKKLKEYSHNERNPVVNSIGFKSYKFCDFCNYLT